MPRVGRKMKGGENSTFTIGTQEYKISSEEINGETKVCVSVPKPEPAPDAADAEAANEEAENEEAENKVAVDQIDGGKRRRRRNTAKKGGKSAKKGGKLRGTRKRRGRKGGKK
tara:strand:+ start:765 stop:1103 length:339 start_codon:yes stop_codon:yes gene_type:complete